jgi:fructosamine-3-kinase
MLEKEVKGIQLLASAGEIDCPERVGYSKSGNQAFLILDWIDPQNEVANFWQIFGMQLAKLHKHTSNTYGLSYNNYIGNLNQLNASYSDFFKFYIESRLEPQFKLAFQSSYFSKKDSDSFEKLINDLPNLIPVEQPALIHGDLWSGNYMVNGNGLPCLIDPSTHLGHRETDLAMTRLFGGFHPDFYAAYHIEYPLKEGFSERIELFQLYYLLVHVNLFGSSYVGSCRRIIQRYK